jgi:hypothetical protein
LNASGGRDAEEQHRLVQSRDQSAPTVEPTIENLPRKRCAPDDDGEDRVELHLVPRARYVDGHDLGDREEPADGRERAEST